MKCIYCNAEIETDDNFCPSCGHWTAKGYKFLNDKDNLNMIFNGEAIKQNNRLTFLIELLAFTLALFMIVLAIRGENIFRPLVHAQKKINNYIYGYSSSVINTNNKYNNVDIDSYDEAIDFIKKDFEKQSYNCDVNTQLFKLEDDMEKDYDIPSILLCDMSYDEALKIKEVIDKIYLLFPNIKGALTNITITNTESKSEYVAKFQPMYQFVNIDEDILKFNKVNKTQILLNSYYFLNDDILSAPISNIISENWYVEDATWESTVAHEFGHYISFVLFLKYNNLKNITFITNNNYEIVEKTLILFDLGEYQKEMLMEALNNYNAKYNISLNLDDFALDISKYAGSHDDKGNLIFDEVIAEAIHDYYLHGSNMNDKSYEIIEIIKKRFAE